MKRKGVTGRPALDDLIGALVANGVDVEIRREPSGSIRITSGAPPRRLPKATAAALAASVLRERTARRVQRTVELTAEDRTAREIGRLIASEEGEREPFSPSTVKAWRRKARGS